MESINPVDSAICLKNSTSVTCHDSDGINFYNFGWEDHQTTNYGILLKILKSLEFCLAEGKKVAIHCHAGRGRTGRQLITKHSWSVRTWYMPWISLPIKLSTYSRRSVPEAVWQTEARKLQSENSKNVRYSLFKIWTARERSSTRGRRSL